MDPGDRDRLAEVFMGLAHPTRIAILAGFHTNKSLSDIAEELDITRGTVQDHMERLVQAELMYRPEVDGGSYAVSPIGEHFLMLLEFEAEVLIPVFEELDRVETEVRNQFESTNLPVSDRTVERSVNAEKWQRIADEIVPLIE